MREFSASGQAAVNDLAGRHGFSAEAVAVMLRSVLNGQGGMAQFAHPEFGGSGQWMRGGMTMIGDMFNNGLKYRVDSLCGDLSRLLAERSDLFEAAPAGAGPGPGVAAGEPSSGDWWPGDLGWPNATGAQNNVRYAYFAQSRRLAVDLGGAVTVYDTLDHQIGGVSQQQSRDGSVTFSSQHGPVDLGALPVVSGPGAPAETPRRSAGDDVFATIERLADLRTKGVLSDQEFETKKAELLSRL
jgi:hypothetical protein